MKFSDFKSAEDMRAAIATDPVGIPCWPWQTGRLRDSLWNDRMSEAQWDRRIFVIHGIVSGAGIGLYVRRM